MPEEKSQNEHILNLQKVKERLLQRKGELEQQLAELYKESEIPQVQDSGDHAQSLSSETLKISLQNNELDEYNVICKAIKMIDNGTYGICIECEQPISEKRLKAYPNATRCLVCQELLEERKQEVL